MVLAGTLLLTAMANAVLDNMPIGAYSLVIQSR